MALIYAGPHDLARQAFHQSVLEFEVLWPWMYFGEVVSVVVRPSNLRVADLILVPELLDPLLTHVNVFHAAALGSAMREADGCSGIHGNRNWLFDLDAQFFRPESNVSKCLDCIR